ncbi:MAG: EamA family transporter, partial [Acinetobacter calcoaceticus]
YHTIGGIIILTGIVMAQKKVSSKKSELIQEQN